LTTHLQDENVANGAYVIILIFLNNSIITLRFEESVLTWEQLGIDFAS